LHLFSPGTLSNSDRVVDHAGGVLFAIVEENVQFVNSAELPNAQDQPLLPGG